MEDVDGSVAFDAAGGEEGEGTADSPQEAKRNAIKSGTKLYFIHTNYVVNV